MAHGDGVDLDLSLHVGTGADSSKKDEEAAKLPGSSSPMVVLSLGRAPRASGRRPVSRSPSRSRLRSPTRSRTRSLSRSPLPPRSPSRSPARRGYSPRRHSRSGSRSLSRSRTRSRSPPRRRSRRYSSRSPSPAYRRQRYRSGSPRRHYSRSRSPDHRRGSRYSSRSPSPEAYRRRRHSRSQSPDHRRSSRYSSRSPRRASPSRPRRRRPSKRSGVGEPGNNIFIAGFSFHTTEKEIERKFSKFGRVLDVRVVRDKKTRESRGFAFLTLERDEDADAAIEAVDQTEWNGRVLLVEKAKTPTRF